MNASARPQGPGGAVSTALIVAPSPVPLRLGGAERHWDALRRSLEDAGVATDLVKLPVREDSLLDLLDAYEAFRLLDVSHVDLVVTGKYPAWMVAHPNHVVWMLHPLRGLYDTWNAAAHEGHDDLRHAELDELREVLGEGTPRRSSPGGPTDPLELIDLVRDAAERLGPTATDEGGALAFPGPIARAVVHRLDAWALDRRRVRRHMAISEVVARRPGYMPEGVRVEVLLPPSALADPTPSEVPATGAYLTVGRLEEPKRIDLAIGAFSRLEDADATLTIIGDGSDRDRLEALAAGDHRVHFAGRVSDDELARAYRASRAVLVTPRAEDFGYVTIEALQAGRPVITTTDSGGPAELVSDRTDSLVTEATPRALAVALEAIHHDDELASSLADGARATAAHHSWPQAARTLLAPAATPGPRPGRRGKIAAVSTYPVDRWPGGGPERARNLLGSLAANGWDVEVVAISPEGRWGITEVSDGLTEVRVPLSRRHLDADRRLRRLTANLAVTDITAGSLWPASAELVGAVSNALDGADAVVAVQPYLAPMALQLAPGVPLLLDAHNHERTLKSHMLPDDEAGRWMLQRVIESESAAVTGASLVVASTTDDARGLESDHSLEPGAVLVVPNGVDTRINRPANADAHATARTEILAPHTDRTEPVSIALFVGSAHQPNIDAAHEIIRMAPRLTEVLFVLSGEHSDMLDQHHLPANVMCVGRVGDRYLQTLLAAADVALNPMRSGSGSNLKVLGYLAAGVPVLSTPTGVRGMEDPQRFATIARIDRFEDALRAMISGSEGDRFRGKLSRRAEAARRMVETTHDWQVIAEPFEAAVEQVAGLGHPVSREPDR